MGFIFDFVVFIHEVLSEPLKTTWKGFPGTMDFKSTNLVAYHSYTANNDPYFFFKMKPYKRGHMLMMSLWTKPTK